jgi:hypothetical protein
MKVFILKEPFCFSFFRKKETKTDRRELMSAKNERNANKLATWISCCNGSASTCKTAGYPMWHFK